MALTSSTFSNRFCSVPSSFSWRLEGCGQVCCLTTVPFLFFCVSVTLIVCQIWSPVALTKPNVRFCSVPSSFSWRLEGCGQVCCLTTVLFLFFCVSVTLVVCQIWSPVALTSSTFSNRFCSEPTSLSWRLEGCGQVCSLTTVLFLFFCVSVTLVVCQIWSPVALTKPNVRFCSEPTSFSWKLEGCGQVCCPSSERRGR